MAERILICGVNWLGDSVMTMPALQALRGVNPDARIDLLVKPPLVGVWEMHGVPDSVIPLASGLSGVRQACDHVRRRQHDEAYIFPNSLRSALVPWIARVPRRIGARGHSRSWLLTDVVNTARGDLELTHQCEEYYRILGLSGDAPRESPSLSAPGAVTARWRETLGDDPERPLVAVVPGAARGPSKRWPAGRFAAVAAELADSGARIVVLGAPGEAGVCAAVTDACGHGAVNLAGGTSLADLVAVLGLSRALICNDSGGMHLATAVGTPVVAVFGLTDPVKTGPLGTGHRLLLKEGLVRTRDVPRDSVEATEALAAVSVADVSSAVQDVLGWKTTA